MSEKKGYFVFFLYEFVKYSYINIKFIITYQTYTCKCMYFRILFYFINRMINCYQNNKIDFPSSVNTINSPNI